MTVLEEAKLLMNQFRGSDLAFGRSEMTNKITQTGKHEARSWTEKRPITEEDWRKHVEGVAGIGIPPIDSKSQCTFGAIDVDQYRGLSLEDLSSEIAEAGLPLVVCRSKSGGPHIFLFVSEPIPASDMVEKLDMLAGFFGFGESEIFPKQVSLGSENSQAPDYGNWINMPYFNGVKNFRYALNETGQPIESIKDFVNYAQRRTVTPKQFAELTPPDASDDSILPDGPPCLNHIFKKHQGSDGNRNIILSNVAVYLKKARPDDWQDKLDDYNRLFSEPLPSREIEALKKSYARKDYRYQCRKQPLCNYCNSQICKSRAYGIDTGSILPNNRSLTVINTSPPIWYLDITSGEAEVRRISLSTDELQRPQLFQKRCMEVLKIMPPTPKAEEWVEIVQGLLKHCTEIDMPKEMSPTGQLIEMMENFILDRSSTDSPEDMLRGLVFCGPLDYCFRWKDFKEYLESHRFDALKQNEILAVLKTELNSTKDYQKIANKGTNFLKIKRSDLKINEPDKLTITKVKDPF